MPLVLDSVADLVGIVERGGVVVIPTETVYGLACRPDRSVDRIIAIKGRDGSKAIQLLIPGADWLDRFGRPSPQARELARAFWPGPLTLVVEASDDAPTSVVADGSIGLRVPGHDLALALLARTGPLAASSANPSGRPTPATVSEIAAVFGDDVDGYLDAGRIDGSGSTVMSFLGTVPQLLREGPISAEDVTRVLQRSI